LATVMALCVTVGWGAMCHPQCKWQCDDPSCPAVCHPICERPKCEMRCEETTCAKCTVHCEKPVCTIRCPKDQCEKEGCPKCESVCKPAQCHTSCAAPEPKCSPVCEELSCNNKCARPTNCAKPKCELQCEKAACEEPAAACNPAITTCSVVSLSSALSSSAGAPNGPCCPCTGMNLQVGMNNADFHADASRVTIPKRLKPSFLELHHEMQHRESIDRARSPCCPCFAMTGTDAPYGPTPTPPPHNTPEMPIFL